MQEKVFMVILYYDLWSFATTRSQLEYELQRFKYTVL